MLATYGHNEFLSCLLAFCLLPHLTSFICQVCGAHSLLPPHIHVAFCPSCGSPTGQPPPYNPAGGAAAQGPPPPAHGYGHVPVQPHYTALAPAESPAPMAYNPQSLEGLPLQGRGEGEVEEAGRGYIGEAPQPGASLQQAVPTNGLQGEWPSHL